jgi:hypothetical protein
MSGVFAIGTTCLNTPVTRNQLTTGNELRYGIDYGESEMQIVQVFL